MTAGDASLRGLRRHRVPTWWSDAKLGIMVHWTLASVPAFAPTDAEIGNLLASAAPDALKDVPGITTAMLVKLGENGVKTVEDLAGCATDDLAGWTERKDGEVKHEAGFLDGFDLSREECEAMIMQARLKAGWITEADLAPPAAEGEPAEEAAPAQ